MTQALTPAEAEARYDELKDFVILFLSEEFTNEERMAYISLRVKELKATIGGEKANGRS